MKKIVPVLLSSMLFIGLFSTAAHAEDAPEAVEKDAPVVSVDVKDGVTTNTGNEKVDEAANLAAKCAEKKVALEACPGGFKGVACRKGIELGRYKGLNCPNL